LRKLIEGEQPPPATAGVPTVADLGERLVAKLEAMGRKPSTVEAVESHLRIHISTRRQTKTAPFCRRCSTASAPS
jgi:hypothetical protein